MGRQPMTTERINIEDVDRAADPIEPSHIAPGFEVGEDGQMAGKASTYKDTG